MKHSPSRVHRLWVICTLIASLMATPSAHAAPPGCDEKIIKKGGGFSTIEMPLGTATTPAPWNEPRATRYLVDPRDPNVIFSANDVSLQRSVDGGCTWKEVFHIPVLTSGAPTAPCDGGLRPAAGLYAPGCAFITDVDLAVGSDGTSNLYIQVSTMWVAVMTVPPVMGGFTTWIYRSADGGDSFQLTPDPASPDAAKLVKGAGSLFAAPSDPNTLYIFRVDHIYGYGMQLWVSRDGGSTWSQGTMPAAVSSARASTVVIHPREPGHIWAVFDQVGTQQSPLANYLMRSTDFGTTWSKVDTPVPDIRSMALAAPPGSDDVHAAFVTGVATGRAYLSNDSGGSWQELSMQDPMTFVVFGRSPRYLFLADQDRSVVRVDAKRKLAIQIKRDLWGDHESQKELSYVPGAGLYLLSSCVQGENTAPPRVDTSCRWLVRYTGAGT